MERQGRECEVSVGKTEKEKNKEESRHNNNNNNNNNNAGLEIEPRKLHTDHTTTNPLRVRAEDTCSAVGTVSLGVYNGRGWFGWQ